MNHVHHLQYCRITGVEKDFNTINEYLNNYSFVISFAATNDSTNSSNLRHGSLQA